MVKQNEEEYLVYGKNFNNLFVKNELEAITKLFDSEKKIKTKEMLINYFSKERNKKLPIQNYLTKKEALESMPHTARLNNKSD